VFGLEEQCDGDALVAAGEAVGGVDIAVAGEAESSGVSLAGHMRQRLLAQLAERDARVARLELVGGMNLNVRSESNYSL